MSNNFADVTEIAGTAVSREQIDRLVSRYFWAAQYCSDKDVVEAACGTGAGLGVLASISRTLEAGDYSSSILDVVRGHYCERIPLHQFDAQQLPFEDGSKDVIILFEAIYYLPDPTRFFMECARVVRPGGKVLITTANKDLWDFHPSPYSHWYFNGPELKRHFDRHSFDCEVFGFQSTVQSPLRQRILRPVKRAASISGLMPKTMRGKRWLKRLVFGSQVPMPVEISASTAPYVPPTKIPTHQIDRIHKVLYCAATRRPTRGIA
jgi:ubiquinone/menaquinone biosynthesis C-methylase UbiE